jgi:pyridoxal 5'-phosphate synthase pdxS subunit
MPLKLDLRKMRHGTVLLKRGFAKMQKGGVIMDVTDARQAGIAEKAGAVAVMALERVPADIRASGGVARMADPKKVREIMAKVTIPVMAKVRIGHFAEAQVLEALGVDMIDESEVLTPADPFHHVDKSGFTVPFVCGARDLGEAVRRIAEGSAMIRTKGEAGTGNVIEAVRHQRLITQMIHKLKALGKDEFECVVKTYAEPFGKLEKEARSVWCDAGTPAKEVVFGGETLAAWEAKVREALVEVKRLQRLPVVNFAAGGIATPSDAALMMQLGSDGVFVGSGIFKSTDPEKRAKAIVEAVAHFDDPRVVLKASTGLGEPMKGVAIEQLAKDQRMQERGL